MCQGRFYLALKMGPHFQKLFFTQPPPPPASRLGHQLENYSIMLGTLGAQVGF